MEKWYFLNDDSRAFLAKGYLMEGQTAEQRYRQIAESAQNILGISGFADKFYDYCSKGWYSLATPVMSNYGTNRGLSISCFGSYIPDNMEGILYSVAENGMLSKLGGGTSGYFGDLRPRGSAITNNGTSSGSVHFMQLFDSVAGVVSQGATRRGYFAAYLPIEHTDINEFLEIGTDGNPIQGITTGVSVSDDFMKRVEERDPEAMAVWAKVIKTRSEIGFPYIVYTGNANMNKPECYADKPILASNLCSEIMLPQSDYETFVCVLSSMNLLHYDEWKDTDAVETLTMFLDSVVEESLSKLANMSLDAEYDRWFLNRVENFLAHHRALGLGALGWHSYLQSKMIPFESRDAAKLNYEIFNKIKTKASLASVKMGEMFGVSPVAKVRRNTTLMAIAPTKSSSFILGQVSQGIEPFMSNYFVKDVAKAKTVYKNPYLHELLMQKGKDTPEVWSTILAADGSVQHLDFLTEGEKAVFKTFAEINPETIINQASIRQEFIDQSQSLNLMIPPSMPVKEINSLYFRAWKLGVKSLYYQFSMSAAQELAREKAMKGSCTACEG